MCALESCNRNSPFLGYSQLFILKNASLPPPISQQKSESDKHSSFHTIPSNNWLIKFPLSRFIDSWNLYWQHWGMSFQKKLKRTTIHSFTISCSFIFFFSFKKVIQIIPWNRYSFQLSLELCLQKSTNDFSEGQIWKWLVTKLCFLSLVTILTIHLLR